MEKKLPITVIIIFLKIQNKLTFHISYPWKSYNQTLGFVHVYFQSESTNNAFYKQFLTEISR